MLSKEICEKIWHCHREIEAGEKLLADIKETIAKQRHDPLPPALKDHFGHRADLQLGIPHGDNSHRLFKVSFDLAEPVIRTHIANKKADLARLNEVALLEIGTGTAPMREAPMQSPPSLEVIDKAIDVERQWFSKMLDMYEFTSQIKPILLNRIEKH